jgi:FlaA1/EpsC-like NDP-sugar epimerase
MRNKRILVTGGAGSIGSALVRKLAPNNKIFILDNNETATWDLCTELGEKGYWVKPRIGDIRDKETVADLFEDFKPQIIFHAAAYKHVAPNELYPLEAIQTNVLGTYNVLHEARKRECIEKIVYIGTDKAVNPRSVMGATKLLGELLTKNAGGIVVRFGNVLGSRGSVLPIWERQIKDNKEITVTDPEATRYIMDIEQAVELVLAACQMGQPGETYVLDMGEPVKIGRLAESFLKERLWADPLPIKIIGLRPGEAKHEKLMTEEEEQIAERVGRFWRIR